MKLGTQTGSLINHLHARGVIGQPEPKAGMGATILHWTDRSPATIFRVFTVGKLTYIETRDDDYEVVKGTTQDGSAEYVFKVRVNGARNTFRRAADGMWQHVRVNPETGRWAKTDGAGLRIGSRDRYYDPSF